MSLSYQKLKPVEVRDPRIIIDNQESREYAVLRGGKSITSTTFTTTSISQNSITFSTPPPSGNAITDRKVMFTLSVRLNFTGTVPGSLGPTYATLLNVNRDAPRSFPISSSLDSLTVNINNQQLSVNPADLIQALMWYNVDAKMKTEDFSMTPTARDQSNDYGALVGSIRNPLAVYWNSLQNCPTGRGSANFFVVSNPQNLTANPATLTSVVDVQITEPIFLLTPFIWQKMNEGGLYNVNSMSWTFNFLTQLPSRFWSHDVSTGSIITSSSWAFAGQIGGPSTPGFTQPPTLLFNYITPPDSLSVGPQTPITYGFYDINRFPSDVPNIVSGVTNTYSSNNIQLSSIPQKMYVFMRQRNSDLYANPSNTDAFFSIQNVNVQWNNIAGILSTATQQQLYAISIKNGCTMSYAEWSGGPVYSGSNFATQYNTVGSVFCANFGEDIPLSEIEAPGKNGQYQIQVNVTSTNTYAQTTNATLWLVFVSEGTFTIEKLGLATANIGVITSNDILNAKSNGYVSMNVIKRQNGGDFLDTIKNFFSNQVLPLIKQSKIASNLANLVPVVGPALSNSIKNLGYGDGYHEGYGEGVLVGGVPVGGVPVGGRSMSRSDLKHRLMH